MEMERIKFTVKVGENKMNVELIKKMAKELVAKIYARLPYKGTNGGDFCQTRQKAQKYCMYFEHF